MATLSSLTRGAPSTRRPSARRPGRSPVRVEALKVAVTGAGGRTGHQVCGELLASSTDWTGVYRSQRGCKAVKKAADYAAKAGYEVDGSLEGCAVAVDALADGAEEAYRAAFAGCDAVVLLTSAKPSLKKRSLALKLLTKVIPFVEETKIQFRYSEYPEQVDWEGQKMAIDAAAAAGVRRVVLVSSMGGTQVDNFLNTMAGGNILLWKRKAEMYLQRSGVPEWCVVHPGGLVDTPAGERELVVGVDDELLSTTSRSVSRQDLARVVVHCLTSPLASNTAFDLASKPEGEGEASGDYEALLGSLGGRTCDYSLPAGSPVPLP